jgi:hypothetical protein
MAGGVDDKLLEVNVNGPPAAPVVIFWTATVGVFADKLLVITQVICAAATTRAAGIVTTLPVNVPKVPVLPVTAELESVQLTAEMAKLAAGVSVIVTAVLNAVALMNVGAAGVGSPVPVVVTPGGFDARLVAVNVNVPPMAVAVCF